MKKIINITQLFLIIYILTVSHSFGQPWYYDFGTSTGTFTSGASTTFLPTPQSGGGTARVRIGTGGGSWNLENQTISFGSESYLRGVAPTSTSVNKFSIYDYTPGNTFTLRFRLRLGASDGSANAASGNWYLFIGDGAMYSDNNAFSGTQVFTGIRWTFGTGGSITTSYRNGGNWTNITPSPFSQGTDYIVEIYGNNSTSQINYNYNGAQSVASDKFDLWVDGTLVGDDLFKAQLANNLNIDSWVFYGESSTSNVANIFLDDFIYTNTISDNPLPVELSNFKVIGINGKIELIWSTSTEIQNYGWEIERSVINKETNKPSIWQTIGFVKGSGNSNSPKEYSFIDNTALYGEYAYRLKQIDIDGTTSYSDELRVFVGQKPQVYDLKPFPNPMNPVAKIRYEVPEFSFVNISIYDITGRLIKTLINENKEPGIYEIEFDGSQLASGIYLSVLKSNGTTISRKLQLIK